MASRPVFIPARSKSSFVREIPIEFRWFAGMSVSQKQKSIESLHNAIHEQRGVAKTLEISSKSMTSLGVRLSAFNLILPINDRNLSVEVVYQGSKRFERGGPYTDILNMSSRDAKTDSRLRESGPLLGFSLNDDPWPLEPTTAFYDWLYLHALCANPDLADEMQEYGAFTDIEFNPEKSVNCQARTAALYVSLKKEGLLRQALLDRPSYFEIIGSGAAEVDQKGLF